MMNAQGLSQHDCEQQMYQRLMQFFQSELQVIAQIRTKDEGIEVSQWCETYQERCERYIRIFQLSMELLHCKEQCTVDHSQLNNNPYQAVEDLL